MSTRRLLNRSNASVRPCIFARWGQPSHLLGNFGIDGGIRVFCSFPQGDYPVYIPTFPRSLRRPKNVESRDLNPLANNGIDFELISQTKGCTRSGMGFPAQVRDSQVNIQRLRDVIVHYSSKVYLVKICDERVGSKYGHWADGWGVRYTSSAKLDQLSGGGGATNEHLTQILQTVQPYSTAHTICEP